MVFVKLFKEGKEDDLRMALVGRYFVLVHSLSCENCSCLSSAR